MDGSAWAGLELPEGAAGRPLDGWYVAAHAPARRAQAEEELRRLGVASFCPMRVERQKVRRVGLSRGLYAPRNPARWEDWPSPLFPGYLFVRGEADALAVLAEAQYVDGLLRGATDRPVAVPGPVMALVFAADGARADAPPAPSSAFRKGERIRVEDGPLRARDGIVRRPDGAERIVALLDLMGRFVEVSLPSGSVAHKQE